MILRDDNHGNDPDSRDLIFTTQSLIKRKKTTKHVEKTTEKSSPTNIQDSNLVTTFVRNSKYKSELKGNTKSTYSEHEWVMETQLHKRRLNKDIDYTVRL